MTSDNDLDTFDNGPLLTFDEFDHLYDALKSWNEYSPQTLERGALNFITPEIVKASAQAVLTGQVIQMGLAWNTISGPDNAKPATHYMVSLSQFERSEPTSNRDFIGVDYHGKAVSHMDAPTHIVYRGELFGGKKSEEFVTTEGSQWSSIEKLGPVVTRGVLLDAALLKGVQWLEPGTAVHAEDILAMEKKFGFTLGQGDCVLLRSGHFARREKVGVWNPDNLSAGFHVDVMALLKERKVSVIGADGDSDVRPSPVTGVESPIHVLALPGMGIPLLDNLQLEALATACAQEKRWTFQIALAPLNIPRGTGSPVNPIAIL
jgi:kynurenine formamidase